MRTMTTGILLAIAVAAAGCAFDSSGTPYIGDDDGAGPIAPPDEPDAGTPVEPTAPDAAAPLIATCSISGSQIGVIGQQVDVQGTIVEFLSWIPNPDKPDELVGFELSDSATNLSYKVVAGHDTYSGSGTSWINPRLDEGTASKITKVDFCDSSGGGGSTAAAQ